MHLHYNTFHASPGVCTSETSPWSNSALLWVFGKVHAFFARPARRKHCILFVTNLSCQVHSQLWEERHAGPNSAVFPGCSWFPEVPLNSMCKVCTDKYRSTSLIAKSLSASQTELLLQVKVLFYILHRSRLTEPLPPRWFPTPALSVQAPRLLPRSKNLSQMQWWYC